MESNRLQLTDWENRFTEFLRQNVSLTDGSHDLGHFHRVWKAAQYINAEEGGPADPHILLAAAYFHDLVSLPKNHPERSESSRLSAAKAGLLLRETFRDFPAEKIGAVEHAVHAHSFSAGISPQTAEARILQDADRLEALGAIGIARTFYTAGRLDALLFDAEDPLAQNREPDDRRFALDHFQLKLLRLPALMNTETGRRLAEQNAAWLRTFAAKLCREIAGDYTELPPS